MTFQGKILLVVALAFFVDKIRCEVDTTHAGHIYLNRSIDDVNEASDQIDSDDEGDVTPSESTSAPSRNPIRRTDVTPSENTSAPSRNPIRGTIYEDLQSPEAMQLLTNEYVGLVETEIAANTVKELMARAKAILTNKKSLRTFRQLKGEAYKYMTNPKTLNMIKGFLENRYKYYVNKDTPSLINAKYDKIESFVNNRNSLQHIVFFRKMMVDFLTQPGDVRKRIAEGFTLLFSVLSLPPIPFILS